MFIFVRRADNFLLRVLVYCYNKHFPLEKPTQNISFLEVKNLKNDFFKEKNYYNSFSLINRNNLFSFILPW